MRTTGGSAENGRDFRFLGLSSLSGFFGCAGAGRAGLSSLLRGLCCLLGIAIVMAPGLALAQETATAEVVEAAAEAVATLDTGDTAWMLVSTALVLFMTVPGLALFYGGLVRKGYVLTAVMQSVAIACLVSVLWFIAGYSFAFGEGGTFFGDFSYLFLAGVEIDTLTGTIPTSLFVIFQMTFAIITPALITGAFADRMKFSTLVVFTTLWSLVIYSPLCHMVWGGGLLGQWGVLDFAGGTVVHIASGVAGLVVALMIGKRRGYGKVPMAPHNLVYSVIGVGFLWVGWFGFNAGSALAANGGAAMAMLVTQIAAAAAGISWTAAEWVVHKKPSILGIISGIVAGLVVITPAAGFVMPGAALIMGLAAGIVCFLASTTLKKALGYDDALDVFGIHGVGGALGAILTGVFAIDPAEGQLLLQVQGVLVSVVFVAIGTAILYWIAALVTGGARVSEEAERDGTDLVLHGEAVQ